MWTVIATIIAAISVGFNIFQHYDKRRERRREIKVKLSNGVLAYRTGTSDAILFIEGGNAGTMPVTISSCGLILPDRRKLVFIRPESNVQLPHELNPGKSCTLWIEMAEVAAQLKDQGFHGSIKLMGYMGDQINREHRSKGFRFNIDEWSKKE